MALSSTQICSQAPPSFVLRPRPALFTGPAQPALFSGPAQLCSQAPPSFVHRPHLAFQHVGKHLNEASMHTCPLKLFFFAKKFGTYNF